MKLLTRIINFRVSIAETSIAKYLQPVSLNAREVGAIPLLKLKSEKYLMKNWWSEKPFEVDNQMSVPVFSFQTATFANKSIGTHSLISRPARRYLQSSIEERPHAQTLWFQNQPEQVHYQSNQNQINDCRFGYKNESTEENW